MYWICIMHVSSGLRMYWNCNQNVCRMYSCYICWDWWFQYILQWWNPVKMPAIISAITINKQLILNSNTFEILTQYMPNTILIHLIHLIHPQYRHSTSRSCQYMLNLQARYIGCILMYLMLIHPLNRGYIQNAR